MVTEAERTLVGVDLFEGLPERDLAMLARRCIWHKYQPHDEIIDRESRSGDVYFIIRGRVRVVNYSFSGREIAFDEMGPGGYFGELAAIDGKPRSATVVALTETVAASMSPKLFIEMIKTQPEVAIRLTRELAKIVRASTDRIMDLSTLGAHNRVYAEILREARPNLGPDNTAVIMPVPVHSDLASRVSTTRETVARVLSELSRKDIVKRKRNALVVKDFERLEEMVHSFRGA